jgi:hypothetical protein
VFVLFQVSKCIAEGGFAVGELLVSNYKIKPDGQCTYNVILRRVRATIVGVEKQLVLRILSVCL